MKRLLAIVALAMALALPASTFAASTGGSTSESLSIATSISLVVPASVTYTGPRADMTAPFSGATADTDNPSGLKVTLLVNTDGAGLISVASRGNLAPLTAGGALAPRVNGPLSDSTPVMIANSAVAGAGTFAFTAHVDTSAYVPGVFSGALSFTATTNP